MSTAVDVDTRNLRVVLTVGLLISALVVAPVAVGAQQPSAADTGGSFESHGDGTVELVVRFDEVESFVAPSTTMSPEVRQTATNISRADALATLREQEGVTVVETFWLVNAALVRVETSRIGTEQQLGSVPGVDTVHPNFEIELNAPVTQPEMIDISDYETTLPGVQQVRAPTAWKQTGTQGDGVRVAVLDTGVDTTHPDVDLAANNWAEFDSVGDRLETFPNDPDGHGTHVSGTITGDDTSGVSIGVAPEATLLHGKVLSDGGGTFAQIVSGMEWAIKNDADVITMSFGVPAYGGSVYETAFVQPIRKATELGVVVVTSSGNYGAGSTGSPGNIYDVVSVGAVDNEGDVPAFSSGEVVETNAAWGQDAPSDWPAEYTVPDVTAPGVDVVSAVPGESYARYTGTSMAAPHVAGVTALMISANPQLSVTEVGSTLREQARHPNPSVVVDPRYGSGLTDAHRATTDAVSDARLYGTVSTPDGTPVVGAVVTTDNGVTAMTDEAGQFGLPVRPGTRTVTVSRAGIADHTETVSIGESQPLQLAVSVQRATAAAVLTPQPTAVAAGNEFSVELGGANVESITTEVNESASDVSGSNLSLLIDGTPVQPGESVPVSLTEPSTVTVEVVTDAGVQQGSLVLDHTLEGPYGTVTKSSGRTEIRANPDGPNIQIVETHFDPLVGSDRTLETAVIVENTGDLPVTTEVRYAVDITDESDSFSRAVTLEGGEKANVSWEIRLNEHPPSTGVQLLETASETETSAFSYQSGVVRIANVSSPDNVNAGNTFSVSTTIANTGNLTDREQLRFSFEGRPSATREVSVSPGQQASVAFSSPTGLTPDEYNYSVVGPENVRSGTVTVVPAPDIASYTNSEGVVTSVGLRAAINDWRAGQIDTETLRTVIDGWRTGEQLTEERA